MRIAICFVYILLQIVYLLPWLPGVPVVYAFGLITHIAMAGTLFYWLSTVEGFTPNERLFFQYGMALCAANCVYIFACAERGTRFALLNTPLFAYILGIGLISFIVHCGIRKS
jgi:hypothetical protein